MLLKKSEVNKILVISLTNIGDVILTFPAIDILKNDFPQAKISILIGPKPRNLLENNPNFSRVYIHNKHQPLHETFLWLLKQRKEKYDLVVDLRNSAMTAMLGAKYRTSFIDNKDKSDHMRVKHLKRLKAVYPYERESRAKYCVDVSEEDQRTVESIIQKEVGQGSSYVVVAPGAADHLKRWTKTGFAKTCDALVEKFQLKIVFVGDASDREVVRSISSLMKNSSIDLCARITLCQLAALLKGARLALVNDSAPMHLASYLDIPVVAVFGPTDPCKYRPSGPKSVYVKSEEPCEACQQSRRQDIHSCMSSLDDGKVLLACENMLKNGLRK